MVLPTKMTNDITLFFKKNRLKNETKLIARLLEYVKNMKKKNGETYNKTSLVSLLSRIKVFIKEKNFIKNTSLLIGLAIPDFTKEVNQLQKISTENKEIIRIKIDTIQKLFNFSKSKNIVELVIYLLLVSGNRTNEIFHYLESKDGYYIDNKKVYVNFISKKRSQSFEKYEIYPLITNRKFINLFNKIIKMNNDTKITKEDIIKRLNLVDTNINPHKLRAIYSKIYVSKNINKNDNSLTEPALVQKILHHTNLAESIFYNNIIFEDGDINDLII